MKTIHAAALALAALASTSAVAMPSATKCEVPPPERFSQQSAEIRKAIDTNGDGQVTRVEFLAYGASHGLVPSINEKHWNMLDRDHDGKLSTVEIEGLFQQMAVDQCRSHR